MLHNIVIRLHFQEVNYSRYLSIFFVLKLYLFHIRLDSKNSSEIRYRTVQITDLSSSEL
jgi:hypothetical protein